MRTIAVINQKGGCGKTTVAINLAAVLAAKGKRTLLVDMDPQSHCALGLAVPDAQLDKTIGDSIKAGLDGSLAFSDILWQISRNLDLAPSSISLAGIEQELASAPDKDRRLQQVLSTVADQYEFCVIDCPPSIGLLTFNALRAASEVIIPVETGYFAMQGAFKQQATIQMMTQRASHNTRVMVLATMYDVRTKLAREILSELRQHFAEQLLPVVIHFNSKLKEATSFGQPITEYDPASMGYDDFDKLTEWLLANAPAESENAADSAGNPALSRAAELVERARVLSARTSALADKFAEEHGAGEDEEFAHAVGGNGSSAAVATATLPAAATSTAAGPVAGPVAAAVTAPVVISAGPQEKEKSNGSILTAIQPKRSPNLAGKLTRVYGARCTAQGLLFVQPVTSAMEVTIASDFNDWSETATPLRLDERLGVWQACVHVPPGRYRYRLVVDGKWTHDPYNTYVEVNPYGELNSVVEIEPD